MVRNSNVHTCIAQLFCQDALVNKVVFDNQDVEALFEKGWEVLAANEHLTYRYGAKKLAWEVSATRVDR